MGSWLVTNYGEDSLGPDTENRSAATVRSKRRAARIARQGRQTTGVATLHTIFGADASGVVAESGIELHQFIRRVFLILGRKVLTIAAYLPATHFERLWIAHITWVQDF